MSARKALTLTFFALTFFAWASVASAQENRQYWYSAIDTRIVVNADSTLSVEERQVYHYQGEYHQGWRSIVLKDISRVTDVEVYDGETGGKLQWSSSKRDKTDPSSWGRYTTYKENGAQVIEWYYDLRDTEHTWLLRYKVHGAIIFGTQFDRLYYNLFTDYDVPVNSASANFVLPARLSKADALYGYRTDAGAPMNTSFMREGEKDVYIVSGALFDSGEDFTADLSWEKGYVSQAAFWHDWLTYNYGFVFGGIIVLLSILYWIIYYIRTEVLPKGRGTIVPQYEPPRGLRPALAELLVRERVSRRAWPATIVDLAVRGYVEISEEGKRLQTKSIAYLIMGIFPLAFLVVLILDKDYPSRLLFFIIFLVFVVYFFRTSGFKYATQYEIKSRRPYESDTKLEVYEKSFLKTLFLLNDENVFRTKDLTSVHFNTTKYTQFAQDMQELPKLLQNRVDKELWFEVNFKKERSGQTVGWFIIMVAIFMFYFFFNSSFIQMLTLAVSLVLAYTIIWIFAHSEVRLSQEGRELREEWLGFKLYMETAERYRLQNLTPDLFEKFLPYAMMFGIEKKWAKAFEGMQVAPPSWYHGAALAGTMNWGGVGSGFSASAFSSSFSSSFASAFSSSAGSGASGGGGAGGGGGGGGGGAR